MIDSTPVFAPSAALALLCLAVPAPAGASDLGEDQARESIRRATVSLSVEHVLGWAYEGNTWVRGAQETAAVGEEGFPDKDNVRAVCLGREKGYYVFFTLRSFVDPFYPNPSIQGVAEPPLGPDGRPARMPPGPIGDSDAIRDARLIRYGKMQFVRYEDLGGGKFRVASKADVVTLFDAMPDGPVSLKARTITSPFGAPEEVHGGGKYSRPHEDISVEEHFRRIELGQAGGGLFRFVGSHDVTLIYVPESALGAGGAKDIPTLGIEQPSLAVDLCLQRSRALFGFDFLLMGQETLDKVQRYRPPAGGQFPGFEKLAGILGLALEPQTLLMLKAVDTTLAKVLPDPGNVKTIRDVWRCWLTVNPQTLAEIGTELLPILRGTCPPPARGRD